MATATPNQMQIVADYLSGKTSNKIAKERGITAVTVTNIKTKKSL
jgi:DNA-binding NarL/FixJ family response regulator